MEITDEVEDGGVVERSVTLTVGTEAVPGLQWVPAGVTDPRPTVCIGHGGFQHKRIANVLALARALVAQLGVGVVALDAPEHGDRESDPEAAVARPGHPGRGRPGSPRPPARGRGGRHGAAGAGPHRRVASAAGRPRGRPAVGGGAVRVVGRLDGHHPRAAPDPRGDDRIAAAVLGLERPEAGRRRVGLPGGAGHRPGAVPLPVGRRADDPRGLTRPVGRPRERGEDVAREPGPPRGGARASSSGRASTSSVGTCSEARLGLRGWGRSRCSGPGTRAGGRPAGPSRSGARGCRRTCRRGRRDRAGTGPGCGCW